MNKHIYIEFRGMDNMKKCDIYMEAKIIKKCFPQAERKTKFLE